MVNSATHRASLTHELIANNQVRKVIASGRGREPGLGVRAAAEGRQDRVRVRAAGHLRRAHPCRRRRHPGLHTPVAYGTDLAKAEVRTINGRDCVLENAISGDLALLRADIADRFGNLTFRHAQMNFGPAMATAQAGGGRGARDPGGADRARPRAALRRLHRSCRGGGSVSAMPGLNRNQMAWRAAQDIADGTVVNLGIGIPVLASDHLPAGRDVFFQSENGVIGVGPAAAPNEADTDLVDAGSRTITLRPGATIVDSTASFAMIRGGHIDVTILGAFEVASNGDFANWDSRIPDKGPLVGGAMDLAVGAREVWAIMEHNTRQGAPRLLERCALPLTAVRCVRRVFTDIAVVDVTDTGFVVRELLPDVSVVHLRARTGAPFTLAADFRPLVVPTLPA